MWSDARLTGLIGLFLLVVSMIVRGAYPLAGQIIWWIALALIFLGAIIIMRKKRRGWG